ncbi:hypothetical protein N9470_03065 [Emcibacteraceae bacterium]|nr:hypothetical protein [Emcibacteraceae bacterium]
MNQVKHKQRVTDHGEVFTSDREVNAMLNLVKQETLRIESRFLEPACGTGNFLAEILKRKLTVVAEKYKKSQLEYERNAIIAVSSLYGIDILEDNVQECRERLLEIMKLDYRKYFKQECKDRYFASVQYILRKNILWGDALTLNQVGTHKREPITFAEWSPVSGSMIKRRDYTLAHLLAYQPMEGDNLFSDLGDKAFIPKPIKEYPLTHFLELSSYA